VYAVAVSILFKDGKLDELKDFFENTGFPALEVLKGEMYSIAFFNPKDNVNLGIAFMKDKETAEKFAEIRNENLLQIQDILASFPRVYEGELLTGKTLKDSLVDDAKDTMFLAFAKLDVKNADEYMNLQKEIYLPKLEEDEGIISYGSIKIDEKSLVLFEFWTSHDAKHSFDEKLNADENVYEKFMPMMDGFTDYYGEPYAIRQFVDFKAGESIN
jgi:quinol monooxygenase YgiN